MKLRIYKICNKLLIFVIFILKSTICLALTSDNQQPIYISATKQTVDMENNIITLTGNVIIKRGSIDIRAEEIIITRLRNKDNKEIIEGYGNPIMFYQLQDNGKPVSGYSCKLRYETINDLIILTGNAYLEQLDSNIKGDTITFLIKKHKMQAFSNKGKRVKTTLLPKQLQDKRNIKSIR